MKLEVLLFQKLMEEYNFSKPTRQSAKGIIITTLITLWKRVKQTIALFALILLQWLKRPEFVNRYAVQFSVFLLIMLFFLLVKEALDFKNFTFQIKENQFSLKQGIFKRTKIVIPKSKIQNIQINQNFLHQLLNVVQVNIDSSGDQGDEIQIKALSKFKAQALRKALLDNENQISEESVSDKSVVKLSSRDLFLIGLTQNHFRNLMIVSVGILSFYKDISDFLIEFGSRLDSQFISLFWNKNIIIGSIFMVFFLLILGFLYSIVTIFITNFNFSIKKTNQGLVIQKGLINKIEFTVQIDKIQSVVYVTNFLKSKFGFHTLRLFQTATENKIQKKRDLVGLKKSHLRIIESHIFGFYPLEEIRKNKPHIYYLKQLVLKAVLIIFAINIYILFLPTALLFFTNFGIIPYAVFIIYLRWKKCYYHFDKDYLVIGSGGIDTVTSIAEIHKIQSVKLTQTYFQKRQKLFNLHFDTASNNFEVPCIDCDKANAVYNYLLYKIEVSNLEL